MHKYSKNNYGTRIRKKSWNKLSKRRRISNFLTILS